VQEVDTSALPIGRALKVERVAAGVSSTAIAEAIGISIGHLSRIEKGERTASDELVLRIREAIRTRAQATA
jgi:transcriptional regulator with XRE-family HTH domain